MQAPRKPRRMHKRVTARSWRRGGLSDAPDQYQRNAVLRCAEFQGTERSACEARVFNPSRVEGSVEAGGIVRESVIITPVK